MADTPTEVYIVIRFDPSDFRDENIEGVFLDKGLAYDLRAKRKAAFGDDPFNDFAVDTLPILHQLPGE